jgi:YHS domain-containing protein
MKTYALIAALAALILAGCGSGDQTATPPADTPPVAKTPETGGTPAGDPAIKVAYDEGSIKKGDKAHCVICVVKEGSKDEEAVAETLDYQGKTYAFCNENEKAEFISDPAKYAAK